MGILVQVGLVAIGRNEGQRLEVCLKSALGNFAPIVYVDSGSTDGSVGMARSLGIEVVELDLSIPFTAARARNEGFARLLELSPDLEFVQFVDGDCEVVSDWPEQAQAALEASPDLAVVCGRRRERYPEQSIYNRLCDLEWDTPVGEADACGGDSMMRVAAFQQAQGFNPSLIAGEEPELCLRMRRQGWKILRLDAEMTLHDANMMQFGQWWKRVLRAGHAYAEGAWLHGRDGDRHWVKESRSIWLWGFVIPLVAVAFAGLTRGFSLLLLLGYAWMVYRIYQYGQQRGWKSQDALLYAVSCMVGKFPNLMGQLRFHKNRLLGQQNRLIEYK
ncbi:MAG: glycosyltransferase [Oculatellaceae cyanobacterium Prado106]|jgi:glycosyltransferase involved in cell wall biosynthesis|nr:glycosyltransferase [Oculatellaceae cyanobacterium Prado106]